MFSLWDPSAVGNVIGSAVFSFIPSRIAQVKPLPFSDKLKMGGALWLLGGGSCLRGSTDVGLPPLCCSGLRGCNEWRGFASISRCRKHGFSQTGLALFITVIKRPRLLIKRPSKATLMTTLCFCGQCCFLPQFLPVGTLGQDVPLHLFPHFYRHIRQTRSIISTFSRLFVLENIKPSSTPISCNLSPYIWSQTKV